MKVLFAVNNDKISEAVIKKYPKDYKELLSYKNVYYFNAILKEIQNDKSYDRIVISEDLEPFVNTNHDSIDNFIFNHLDKISDEAQGNDGKEISIILICSERRTFGSNILNKLFSIGIYNALIGNDRSMDNLCKLINRPRNKKEAKLYYRIDQATYESAVDNGEVSEPEIQNILNYFKKLGKSTDRYTDSFNNIAAQYTDDQLKLIINVLPMKVKAVLEAESEKYQMLMGVSGENRRQAVGPVEPGIRVNTIGSGNGNNMNGPIVIPSGVKRFTNTSRPIIPNNTGARQNTTVAQNQPVQQRQVQPTVAQRPQVQANSQAQNNIISQRVNPVAKNPVVNQQVNQNVVTKTPTSNQTIIQNSMNKNSNANQPIIPKSINKNPVSNQPMASKSINDSQPIIQKSVNNNPISNQQETKVQIPQETVVNTVNQSKEQIVNHGQRYTGTIAQVKRTLIARRKVAQTPTQPVVQEVQASIEATPVVEEKLEEAKRGRGRPRKPITEQEIKPKGKRGRPRKNASDEENSLDELLGGIGTASEEDSIMMPGLDDSEEDGVLPGLDNEEDYDSTLPALEEDDEETLPGLENDDLEVSEETLPGLDDEEDDNTLSGFDDNNDDGVLPGLDNEEGYDDSSLPSLEDDGEDTSLPGLGDDGDYDDSVLPDLEEDDEGTSLPGLDNVEDNSDNGEEVDVNSLLAGLDDDDDATLPGLDNTENEDSVLPGLDNEYDDSSLPGLEDDEDDSGILPGLNDDGGYDDSSLPGLEDDGEDTSLPGLDDDEGEEETLLQGMGFEDDNDNNSFNDNTSNSNAIESIKPQIDYSMSNLNSLLSKDKKIVAFVGATKNGTSFLINNLALMFSMMGINTAILDMTQNKNSYYLFTDSREELRKIAYTSLSKLENGYADGIKFNKNLTVYTSLPSDTTVYENAEPILSTLVQNHSLVLIDTDFTTPPAYFASSQEIYLVQSMDIMTIQPLTAFLRELKFKGAWEPEKARVVINKEVPIRILSNKTIIGGMSRYNGPDMSVMTDLFNKDMVKACSIPFDEKVYSKYLETLATCKLSISSLPKQFRAKLQILGEMVYPRLNSKTSYNPSPNMGGGYIPQGNQFSNNTNNTLNKMKKKF